MTPQPTSPAQSQLKLRLGPDGVHIFDRSTGLNVLLDEVQVPPYRWAAAPRHVSIALTNACDLACPYCYAPKDSASLGFERLLCWLTELDTNGCLGVGFGGGEPTLYPHFAELCRAAAMKTALAVTFTTHLHRLDEALLDALPGSVHFARVSVDGVGTTYESLRGRPFDVLVQRLKILRTIIPFGINYVVNARTLPDLEAALELAADVGATEFLLLPEERTRASTGVDAATLNTLRSWVAEYRGKVRLSISEASSEGFPICTAFMRETGLRAYAHIDARGVLRRSSFDLDGEEIGHDGVLNALMLLQSRIKECQ